MNVAQMIRAMQWVEVSSEYEPDTRRMIRTERIALTAAVKSGNGIAEAVAQANDTAAMWGVDLAAVKMPNDNESEAYKYAKANQSYTGTWEEWQAMDADTRHQYELGAAGIPTK